MNYELKPYPFRGGDAEVTDVKPNKTCKPLFAVACKECGAQSRTYKPIATTGKWAISHKRESIELAVVAWSGHAE